LTVAKIKHFMVVWKTITSKYEFYKGTDIADACNNAGIGHGAIGAIDYHADITAFVNSKTMQKALREVADYGEHGYFWKRETCAKLARLGANDVLIEIPGDKAVPGGSVKGWKVGPAGIALLNKFCKE
jgi:hypothetical protein